MDAFLQAVLTTADIIVRLGSVMFVTLFGMEILIQLGIMTYLRPIGRPVAKLARLPSESAVSFLTGIGSMIAAHTLIMRYYETGRVTDRQLVVTGVLNTVPFHFKETFTFQLPVVLPLLGWRLSLIYITAFWLTGIIKLGFVVVAGRVIDEPPPVNGDAFVDLECRPDDRDCLEKTFFQKVKAAWRLRKRMFFRMILMLFVVTFLVQYLVNIGALGFLEQSVGRFTSLFHLPPQVVGPVTAYMISPTAGITYMSNLLSLGSVSGYQAITALLAGGIPMILFTRLRRTLPRYTAIFGVKNGFTICGLTALLSMVSRVLVLIGVLLWYS